MSLLVLCALLVLAVVVLTPLSPRLGVPQPVLITVFGLLVAFVPAVPTVDVPPAFVLPVVLPPLLFAATLRTSAREFRESAVPVLMLAVGLAAVTALVVALAAHLAGLPWAPAFVLGAVVSPPDPVAATTVARQLRLPGRLVTILEGEGLFNDATALVLFKVALAAAVTGHLSAGASVLELVLAVVAGCLVGLALGWLAQFALGRIDDSSTETTITIVLPYAAYLLAEQLRGSGVLAVLVAGLYLRTGAGHRALTSRGWLDGRAVWRYADFALTSGAFALVGLELTDVLQRAVLSRELVLVGATVLLTVMLIRALWVFPAAALLGRRERNRPISERWRETTVVAWSGMRGVVTVATALSIPLVTDAGRPFPHRDDIQLVALAVVLVTLVAQGLTLAPLVHLLHVGSREDEHEAVRQLRKGSADAAQQALQELRASAKDPVGVDVVLAQYRALQESARRLRTAREGEQRDDQVRQALLVAVDAEREAVLDARRTGSAPAEAVDEVLAEIEARALRVG